MATYEKIKLLNGASGEGIPLGSSGTSIPLHTTEASTSIYDEVWLYGSNTGSAAATVTITVGGGSNKLQVDIPAYSGMYLLFPGLFITGVSLPGFPTVGTEITATDNDSTDSVYIFGYVNRIIP